MQSPLFNILLIGCMWVWFILLKIRGIGEADNRSTFLMEVLEGWLIAIFLFSYCMIISETVQVAENKFWVMLLQYSSVLGAISSLFLVLLGLYVVKEKKKDESNNE